MAQVDRAAEEAEAVAGTFLEKAGHVGTAGNHHHHQLPKLELGLLPMPISAFFHKPPDTTHVAGCMCLTFCWRKVMWWGQVSWGRASRTNLTQQHQGAKGWAPPAAKRSASQHHGPLPKQAHSQGCQHPLESATKRHRQGGRADYMADLYPSSTIQCLAEQTLRWPKVHAVFPVKDYQWSLTPQGVQEPSNGQRESQDNFYVI